MQTFQITYTTKLIKINQNEKKREQTSEHHHHPKICMVSLKVTLKFKINFNLRENLEKSLNLNLFYINKFTCLTLFFFYFRLCSNFSYFASVRFNLMI